MSTDYTCIVLLSIILVLLWTLRERLDLPLYQASLILITGWFVDPFTEIIFPFSHKKYCFQYWLGPFLGSLLGTGIYIMLKQYVPNLVSSILVNYSSSIAFVIGGLILTKRLAIQRNRPILLQVWWLRAKTIVNLRMKRGMQSLAIGHLY